MKLDEFLNQNVVTGFEYIENVTIINVIVEDSQLYGIDIDTSNIESGTPVLKTSTFTIIDDILHVEGLELNILETYIISIEPI
jgi:hypothetical protein